MQFTRNGPDVPERLLQAHEDGRVVFFCGAGISYPAGLPGFAGLVERLFSEVGATPTSIEATAVKNAQHDIAIGLLEGRVVGGRATVRQKLAGVLTPASLSPPAATATHEALLALSKGRDGRYRLITTNCDRIFEEVIPKLDPEPRTYEAPLLPVPKRRWVGGLVYLHGLIPVSPKADDLDHIVISSGDFGLAYLTERWAARFVSELFRNFTVCFVGYSINDPVLRYMTDALAADRQLGESPPEMFAFGNHPKGKEQKTADQWKAKNVTPILYRNHNRHAYLHRTLREWSAVHRDGIPGKERIVVQYATNRPLASTKQDDLVGRMIWALSDKRALPAKRFAELDPVPPFEWLEPLAESCLGHSDLPRFDVQPDVEEDQDLAFSVVARPAPYRRAPWMMLVQSRQLSTEWDDVMLHLARWLARHLENPKLILWVANHGGVLHPRFASLIGQRLDENPESSAIRTLWILALSGRLKGRTPFPDSYEWREHFEHEGLTPSLRMSLLALLSPRVRLKERLRWFDGDEDEETNERVQSRDLVDWEIVLNTDHAHSFLKRLADDVRWSGALPDLLRDATGLLHDAVDLMHELAGADDRHDLSFREHPSIEEHPQNRGYHDWTALIDLARDAWLAAARECPQRARLGAQLWMDLPYPVFHRLAFFAATRLTVIPPRQGIDWLLSDEHWWLWSVETQREAIRLVAALAPGLAADDWALIEEAILEGPPRRMFSDDTEDDVFQRIVDREIWIRLARSKEAGGTLGTAAVVKIGDLCRQYPAWHLAADQRDEFPVWIGDGGERREFQRTPEHYRELLDWLLEHPIKDSWHEDDWRELCRRDVRRAAAALTRLSRNGGWLAHRWADALYAWSDKALAARSWRCVGSVIAAAPDGIVTELAHPLGSWLQETAKHSSGSEGAFFGLIRRTIALYREEEIDDGDDAVSSAINHPIGHVTWAALQWWFRQQPEDGQGLPEVLGMIFSDLCDTRVEHYRHGRVLLAAHVIALYRVAREWSSEHLLPVFDWDASVPEACAAWSGFLWSPRVYRPLMDVIKAHFLATAEHYGELGKNGERYATILTFAALEPRDTFSRKDLAVATRALPHAGLEAAAEALVRALEGAGEQRTEYWRNRVRPFLKHIWPKSREVLTPGISKSFARLCVATQDAFPEALSEMRPWLRPIEHHGLMLQQLCEATLPARFPAEALGFLDATIRRDDAWIPGGLGGCLDGIASAQPSLESDMRFQRLRQQLRLRGGA